MKQIMTGVLGLLVTLLAGCGEEVSQQNTKQELTLAYVEWSDSVATTNVIKVILEDRMGYQVDAKPVTASVMWKAVATGGADAMVTAWLPTTHQDYYADYKDQVVNLGPNLEGAKVGLVVPVYVTIDSITEINENADKFDNQIIGIEPGAGIMRKTEKVIEDYNLTDMKLVSSSGAVMTSQLGNRIEEDKWVVVTGWTPHWKFHRWDLKYLEDPKNIYGGEETSNTIVRQGLKDDHPDVYTLLDNFKWGKAEINQLMVWNQEQGANPEETARRWVNEHTELVNSWLPAKYHQEGISG